jgi:Putative peptidoglycan binding domain
MRWAIGVALAGIALLSSADPPAKSKQSNASKGKVSSTSAKSSSTRRSTRKRNVRRASGPSYQAHPDPERYQQIQQALADRGYFKGQVNGQWGDDSTDALKRFQADQKLFDDGKINSLTLIGLGLGPKHDGSAVSSQTASTAPIPPAPVSSSSDGTAPPQ